ncbi:uncharacterized protein [Musca autumnalis]|uniref:uncharacterized protein n=1 Tax=Musca autumnalis TaxID=221902 RepID=UPI003CF1C896
MACTNLCRLCRTSCSNEYRLRDEHNNATLIYQISTRFFHPTFLEIDYNSENPIAVLCSKCWENIFDFHNFKQSILSVQEHFLRELTQPIVMTESSGENVTVTNNQSKECITPATSKEATKSIASSPPPVFDIIKIEETSFHTETMMSFEDLNQNYGSLNSADIMNDETTREKQERNISSGEEEHDDEVDTISLSLGNITDHSQDSSEKNQKPQRKTSQTRKTSKQLDAIIAELKPTMRCYVCNDNFEHFQAIQDHFLAEHLDNEFYILCCDRKFSYRNRFIEHILYHRNPNNFQCSLCGTTYSCKKNLDEHNRFTHPTYAGGLEYGIPKQPENPYKYKCEICEKGFRKPYLLREHLGRHSGSFVRKCNECGREFTHRSSLYLHQRMEHPKDGQSEQRECPDCGKIYKNYNGLYHHLRSKKEKGITCKTKKEKKSKTSTKAKKQQVPIKMACTNLCRLCRTSCSNEYRLRDEHNSATLIYQISTSFFNPTFLEIDHNSETPVAVLCSKCWENIFDFHNFKQSILAVQGYFLRELAQPIIMTEISEGNITVTDNQIRECITPTASKETTKSIASSPPPIFDIIKIEETSFHTEEVMSFEDSNQNYGSLGRADIMNDETTREEPERSISSGEEDQDDEVDINLSSLENITDHSQDSSEKNQKPQRKTNQTRKTPKQLDVIIAKLKPTMRCYVCNENFEHFQAIQDHFLAEHLDNEFYILCCDRKFAYRHRFIEHILYHKNPNNFQCSKCGTSFTCKKNLSEHNRYIHPIDADGLESGIPKQPENPYKYKCEICEKGFRKPYELREHLGRHSGSFVRKCNECGREFTHRASLNFHMRMEHAKDGQSQQRECPDCGKTYKHYNSLYHHLRRKREKGITCKKIKKEKDSKISPKVKKQ